MTARRLRAWRMLAVLAAVISLLVIIAGHCLNRSQPTSPSSAIGAPFPHLGLTALPGTPSLADADLRAGHATLVNLFASWCLPCRVEAPQLATLRADGVSLVGIAVRDAPGDTAAFLAATGTPFDRVGLDPRERVQPALLSAGIPETWLVDGRGIVRARFRGDLHAADLPTVRAAVEAAR